MYTRLVTKDDIQAWLDLAHEGDRIIGELIPDISVFYKGFDEYMQARIKKNEAFMVVDTGSGQCAGIAAFSRKSNRISFLGVSGEADFPAVGSKLLETVLGRLDTGKEITVNVIKSDDKFIKQERQLYTDYGFVEDEAEVFESGVPVCLMKKPPVKKQI
jgi:hypothetical protein